MMLKYSFLCHVLEVNVVGYDYTGYGSSSGGGGGADAFKDLVPSERAVYGDIESVSWSGTRESE